VYGWDLAALCNQLTPDFRHQQRADGWFQMFGAPISLDYPALKEPLAHLPWLATFSMAIVRSSASITTPSGSTPS